MSTEFSTPTDAEWGWERLLAWMQDGHDGLTQGEIRAELGTSVKATSNRLDYLKKKNGIRRDDDGRHWLTNLPLVPVPARGKRKPPRRPQRPKQTPQQAVPAPIAPTPAEPDLDHHELGDLTWDQVTTTLVKLRWPKYIPTEKFEAILEWRTMTERLLR